MENNGFSKFSGSKFIFEFYVSIIFYLVNDNKCLSCETKKSLINVSDERSWGHRFCIRHFDT
jgi:hypothetical protein